MKKYKSAKEIKVGVVGYGGAYNMGQAHLTQMRDAGMTPAAVVEIDPKRLAVAQTDFPGIGTFGSVSEMLAKSDVELVTIITPHNTHAPLALECLEAERHVICEKPFAITTAECDAVIAAAKKADRMASTYHNRHWDGCILRAVEEVRDKKVIGDVFRIEAWMGGRGKPRDWWRSSRSISGGILYDWGVHLLEYALQIIDSEIIEVSGYNKEGFWAHQTTWKDDSNEDEAKAVIRFKNGAWIDLTISALTVNPKPGYFEIQGTHGSYVFEGGHYTLHHSEDGVAKTERGPHPGGQCQRYYENIAAYLTGAAPLVITPEWARRPIHVLDLAAQSARQGTALRSQYA
jgi:scyllo-inositol 2-dehydrogenase (NADP+)